MANDFSTGAELELTVSQRSLRSARDTIESELGDLEVGVDAVVSGGGGGSSGMTSPRRRAAWEQQRTEDLRDILNVLQDMEDNIGESGGGGGLTSLLLAGRAGAAAGGVGAGAGLSGLLSGAGGVAGLAGIAAAGPLAGAALGFQLRRMGLTVDSETGFMAPPGGRGPGGGAGGGGGQGGGFFPTQGELGGPGGDGGPGANQPTGPAGVSEAARSAFQRGALGRNQALQGQVSQAVNEALQRGNFGTTVDVTVDFQNQIDVGLDAEEVLRQTERRIDSELSNLKTEVASAVQRGSL